MPSIAQAQQPGGGGGGTYTETPEQKEAWRKVRAHIRELGLDAGDTFTVKGTVTKILLDGTSENPRYFTKKIKDTQTGEEKDWPYIKCLCAITDPRFGKPGVLDFPAKNVGAKFFDGRTRQGRSSNRGGMFNLHVAVYGQEPSQELKDGKGTWDTEDYESKPLMLQLKFEGKEDPDSPYADRRLGMKIFVAGFEKDRDVHRSTLLDDDDDPPFPTEQPAKSADARNPASSTAAEEATKAANLGEYPATDRQVQFMYRLGQEAYMTKADVQEWCKEIYSQAPEELTRKDASAFIDALQRRRNEDTDTHEIVTVRKQDEGKDELVSVGVAKPVAVTDDDSFD